MALTAGTRLGPYEVLTSIGAGGMGDVYRAHDPRLGRDVAIKVLPSGFSADPDRLRRFEQEARAAAALNHPNILAVYDLGTHDGAPYIVSELLSGTTLREALEKGVLPVRKAVDYAIQVAHGLATAHEKGIVHRDVKPENLFITSDGPAKILDFGIAKLIETVPVGGDATTPPTRTSGTTPGIVLGTMGSADFGTVLRTRHSSPACGPRTRRRRTNRRRRKRSGAIGTSPPCVRRSRPRWRR